MTIESLRTEGFPLLIHILRDIESAVVAYSGGVDSTFLLKAAATACVKTIAATAVSPTMPQQDLRDAEALAQAMAVTHVIIETSELDIPEFVRNPVDRCFYCKDELFKKLTEIALSHGCRFVLDGSNVDDLNDWRPGRKAAEKHGIRSPLIEAGLRKEDVRRLSRELKLPTWDKPSSPCLSSRFPYGVPITREGLKRVEEAETYLKSLGFKELRVRCHTDSARIEVREDDIPRMLAAEIRSAVREHLRSLGFRFVSLDLDGFRSGRLNG